MTDLFKDRYFPIDPVDVRLVFDFILFKYFDGHFVASNNVSALFHLSKGALTLGFSNDESTDLLAFTVFLLFWFNLLD